ncbi:MAG: signal peptidase I, partial [Leptolyngbyaceae cyanobacterium]
SLLWPGLGQLYSRAGVKGTSLAIATLGLLYFLGWSLFAPNGNTVTGLLMIGVTATLYLFNLFDAYNTVRPLPKASPRDIYQPHQNRWYAIFLSQILPGFGHLYLQRTGLGGTFLGVGVLTAYLANLYPILLPIPPIIWVLACYHLYRITPNPKVVLPSSADSAQPLRPSLRPLWPSQRWIIVTVMVGIIMMRLTIGYIPSWINQSVLQCIVPSVSMQPTLQVDDRIFVQRNPGYQPQTSDIVVFRAPVDAIALLNATPDTLFVKRVVGLPNQTVEIRNGQVFIDDVLLAESYEASAPVYTLPPIKIPATTYFVLGDNRNESADSHVWGFLPLDDIVGKAYKVYWPPKRVQSLG